MNDVAIPSQAWSSAWTPGRLVDDFTQRACPALAEQRLGVDQLPWRGTTLFMWHITPDGIVPRTPTLPTTGAILGVYVWRMMGELWTSPFNRRGNLGMWQRALAANPGETVRYFLERDPDAEGE